MSSKNFLTSLMFFDIGQLSTLFIFSFSISILLGFIMTSKNPIFYTFHICFSSFIYRLFSSNLLNTSFTILLYPFSVSVSTNTLSTNVVIFSLLIRSLRILFIIAWNIASEFFILKNITVSLKNLTYVINAPFYSFLFLILILLNLHHKFIFVNTFLFPMLSIKSIINGSG